MTREERLATNDKVALEKGRLMQRSGPAARMYRANAPGPNGITCPEPIAAGYLADADRFHSDVSGEELQLRQDRHHRTQQIYENKRSQAVEREETRWKRIEDTQAAEHRYWEGQRELGVKSRKNTSGAPYNTLTLQYNDSLDGERLRYQDDLVRYRASLRTQNLVECGDTRVSYDIINGSGLASKLAPSRPQPSSVLVSKQGPTEFGQRR
jgi:hypothetical protein